MNNDRIYLLHILDCINAVEKSISGLSKRDFKEDKDIQDAIVRRIEIMGEAVKNISNKTKNLFPQIAWKKIAGTRDVLVHAYFSVDLDLVWDIASRDLPKLKKQIEEILQKIE